MADSNNAGNIVGELKATMDDIRGRLDELKGTKSKMEELERQLIEEVGNRKDAFALIESRFGRPGLPAGGSGNRQLVDAFVGYMRCGGEIPREVRALESGDDTKGGYAVPADFQAKVIEKMAEISPVLGYCAVMTTSRDRVEMPKETGAPTIAWVGEKEDPGETQGDWGLGMEAIDVNKARAKIKIGQDLLDDAFFDIESFMVRKIGFRFAVGIGQVIISGDGVKKPEGILTNASVGEVKTGSATTLGTNPDKIIDLWGELPSYYDRGCYYFLNKKTMVAMRKFKDSANGQYLWQPSLVAGAPPTFNGVPLAIMPDMPDIADQKYAIVCADLTQGYQVVQRSGMSMLRNIYSDDDTDEVKFSFKQRLGGRVMNPDAIKRLKVST